MPTIFREFRFMKSKASFAALLIGFFCAVFCLCSCAKQQKPKRTVDPETLRLMQKTQAELVACVERCRSAAAESKDREILLALANSQQVLANRHESIINILLKKYKLEKSPTAAYPIEMDPRTLLLSPVDEYKSILDTASTKKTLREVLIALEITNKVLEADKPILNMIDPDSYEEKKEESLNLFLCPICGLLLTEEPEDDCPVCHSDKNRIIPLQNGELPPQNKESFVVVSE